MNPLVSVIISTKNEEQNILQCLKSIKSQTYTNIEVLVVDNFSTDKTQELAHHYTDHVYSKGPERTTQRNFGLEKATGEYILFLDADMILTKDVIKSAVAKCHTADAVGVIIPEESIGKGFWAKCKKLEKSFYVNNDDIEAARFFTRSVLKQVHGYDITLISGEDWDLSDRVCAKGLVVRINSAIHHNEGQLSLITTLRKKYYYARFISIYSKKNSLKNTRNVSPLSRFRLFFNYPTKLFANPIVGFGMLFMKTLEFTAGGIGLVSARISR